MASLMEKPVGRWSLQFRLRPRMERQTIALGAMTAAQAHWFQERVEALVDAIRADSPPDPSTAKWVAGLSDDLHAKLARAGLVISRVEPNQAAIPTLGPFIDRYIKEREGDTGDGTRVNYGQAKRYLIEEFGATRPIDRITAGDADNFRRHLVAELKLSDNTARRVCGRAKQFFRAAIRHKLIGENPFADMKCSIVENRERDRFITRQEAQAVLDACPDAQWRLLFALSRYGGLRCPSEHLVLRWGDVDWERSRVTIQSPKTKHQGKASRVIPLFPELRQYLEEVWEQAEPGSTYVITRYRDRNSNLRTQLCRILRNAGMKPWEKLFQNLRATRATELVSEGWPEYKVCEWLGHTEAVAKKHYWQVTDEDYQRAAGLPVARPALQTALQFSDAAPCNAMHNDFPPQDASRDNSSACINLHSPAHYCTGDHVTPTGFEPVLPA